MELYISKKMDTRVIYHCTENMSSPFTHFAERKLCQQMTPFFKSRLPYLRVSPVTTTQWTFFVLS